MQGDVGWLGGVYPVLWLSDNFIVASLETCGLGSWCPMCVVMLDSPEFGGCLFFQQGR